MRIERFGLTSLEAEAVVRGCAEGAYSLLTGAGFSLGADTRLKEQPKAPSATVLAQMLAKEFRLDVVPTSAADLPIAYEDAQFRPGGQEALVDYLKRVLTGLTPSWHSVVAEIPWRRVWTLNVDDLPDSIWRSVSRPVHQIAFDQPYRSIRLSDNELQVIYLHGRLTGRPSKDVSLIFSLPEYVAGAASPKSWHEAFFSEFSDQPMIVCGASVVGEFDLARTFRSGNQSSISKGMPSLAVVYNMDAAAEKRFRDRINLIPINVKGEEFFDDLSKDVEEWSTANPRPVAVTASANDGRILGSQFALISDGAISKPVRQLRHDFYAGDEPEWHDIQLGLDAKRDASADVVAHIRRQFEEGQSPIVILTGQPGSGKSTAMLRILREVGVFTEIRYLFRSEDRVDAKAIARCMRPELPVIFAFDLAADFSIDIGELVDALDERGIRFAIIAVDRVKRLRGLANDLRKLNPLVVDATRASNRDANNLFNVRQVNHRLGSYVAKEQRDFRKLVTQKHDGNIFSAMAEVEEGRGFEARLDQAISSDLGEDSFVALAHAVSLTHRWGYPLPLRSASVASGLDPVQIGRLCEESGSLSDIFTIEPKGIKFRHRVLATHFFTRRRNNLVRTEVLLKIISTLGPLVTIDAIRSRSYPFLICRALMDRKAVIDTVGGIDEARDFFSRTEDVLGGNSRFWEQRALLESEANEHERAYSYAHEAASRERHPFPLTTLGRVCMSQAVQVGKYSPDAGMDRFKEGNASLLEARSIARRPEVEAHPFTCFFEYAIKMHDIARQSASGSSFLRNAWDEWMFEAKRTRAIPPDDILRFERNWLTKSVSQ
jgi:hypothetical protein